MNDESDMEAARGNGEQESEEENTLVKENIDTRNAAEWVNEIKRNLLRIEEHGRNNGRRLMNEMKEAWNEFYEDITMSAQTLEIIQQDFRRTKR